MNVGSPNQTVYTTAHTTVQQAFHGLGYDVNGPNSGYNQILNTGFRAWYKYKIRHTFIDNAITAWTAAKPLLPSVPLFFIRSSDLGLVERHLPAAPG